MNSTQQPAGKFRSIKAPKSAVALMIIIILALTFVTIFANIQRLRRGQIETIVVVPASSTTPQPR